MKLKTLKDFEFKARSWAGAMANAGRKYTIEVSGLKQEAIKRAKYYISLLGDAKFECISYGTPFFKNVKTHDDMNFIGRIVEIVEFYNLTEEDLK